MDFVNSLSTFTFYPMKGLQLWLLSAFICCTVSAQSSPDHSVALAPGDNNPVFSFFTVTPGNGNVVLHWSAPSVKTGDFFIVEKSADGQHFNLLSAMNASFTTDSVFSFTDNSVGNGAVFYRIRITGKDGGELSSNTVNINSVSEANFKFYPNPVDKLLIVRSSHPLTVQVVDAYGIVWLKQDVDAGMQIVNVSALQKGNYILKATDKANNTLMSEQLVKNN